MVQFRLKALNQQQKPDDLDLLMRVTQRRGWLAAAVCAAIVGGLLVWSFAGRLPLQVSAPGILSQLDGVTQVESTVAGQVTDVAVTSGDTVAIGATLATVVGLDGTAVPVTALFPGRVTSVLIDEGNVVTVGSTLYVIERTDRPDTRLLAYVFAPSGQGGSLAPGMAVDLSVSSAPSAAFGVLRGTVTSVGPYPASQAALVELLSDEQIVERFSAEGPPIVVVVDLAPSPSTVSGYRWSTAEGPPFALGTGIEVTALITQSQERPIDLVFGR